MKGVIVLGGHVQGLGIVRIYGISNIPTVVIDADRRNLARWSKYCREFYCVDDNEMLGFLFSSDFSKKYRDWMIMATNDWHVQLLSRNKDDLTQYYKIPMASWDIISRVYNKVETYKIAKRIGLKIPDSIFPRSLNDLTSEALEYPIIIKPAVMHSFYQEFGKKVFLCRDKEEFDENIKKATDKFPINELILQQVVRSKVGDQYSACFYFESGISKVSLIAQRCRQHPIDFGNATTFAKPVDIPELKAMAESLLKEINFYGICEVEFMLDESDGSFKFLEVNPRTWKWHYLAHITSSPFLLSLYNNTYKTEIPIVNGEIFDVAWQDILTDLWVKGMLRIKRKNPDKIRSQLTIQAVYDPKDIRPFIAQLCYLPFFIVSR